MIQRSAFARAEKALSRQAAVGLIGPRQVGKTTLAHAVAATRPSLYLDLELGSDRAKLADAELFLRGQADRLVILDEIHRAPEVFSTLRGLIDEARRAGNPHGRFLLLGSASVDLLRQSSESLAGRIEYIELAPFNILEAGGGDIAMNQLWLRGGFPESYLAAGGEDSFALRRSFIRTYLERDVPQFGRKIPAEILERLWTMLSHNQGGLLNASRLASGLALSTPTVANYISLLTDMLLMRRLRPYHGNVGKRLIKSPKTYVRDSGILHALLGVRDMNELAGHPINGASWEGFIIENLLNVAPERVMSSFYRTVAGAEIDLLLEWGGATGTWAIEIKRGLNPKPARGFYQALQDIQPSRAFVVYSGQTRFPITAHVEAIGLHEMANEIASVSSW